MLSNYEKQANTTNDRPNQILTFSTATTLDEVKLDYHNQTQSRECYVVPVSSTSLEHTWSDHGRSTSNQQVSLTCGSQSPNHLETNWNFTGWSYRITIILIQSDRGIRQKKRTKRIQITVKTDYKEENPLQNFYVELASTLEVVNHISNIFVRFDHLCICS